MKPSRYNFFYPYKPDSNKHIAYNSFSNALALMETRQYDEYRLFEKDNEHPLANAFIKDLRKGHFVVDDEVDELALIRHRLLKGRYGSSGLGLTIAPTSDCNFRCVYCYEKDSMHHATMAEETQQAIINFIEDRAPNLSDLHISWFGGEPLLALDIIENMTKRILSLAEEYKFLYSASIVTNGYLLSPENARRMLDCKIASCQVTIDGEAETHNARRPHASGSDTYDVIIKNLQAVKDILPFIILRVNIDKENTDAISHVIETLKELQLNNVNAYPAPILDTNGCYSAGACLSSSEFFRFEYDFIKASRDHNRMLQKYPAILCRACGADDSSAYVIDADGKLYKCWSDIGISELSFGSVAKGVLNPMNEILYIKNDPTHDTKCSKCKFLPICLGGCPHDQRTGKAGRCLRYKYLHKLYMEDIAKIMNEKK